MHTKSTGNPAVPKQNASSFLAPKATAKPSLSRGRGRGKGRGRGRAPGSGSASREGSVASSVHAANSPQMHAVAHTPHVQEDGAVTMQIQEDNRDDGTADGSTNSRAPQDQSDSMSNVEEF